MQQTRGLIRSHDINNKYGRFKLDIDLQESLPSNYYTFMGYLVDKYRDILTEGIPFLVSANSQNIDVILLNCQYGFLPFNLQLVIIT